MAILCVDDEAAVLQSLKEQLKSHYKGKFRYETAESAVEGLKIVDDLVSERTDIILIVSDWLMPGMKGDEFLIKVNKKYPQIAAVLLTGHANEDAIDNAKKNANILTCIYKPWNLDEIIKAVDMAIGKYSV